jgi:RNA polymerase subunit RPABC4/transcription elongation factor Spt4
MSDGNFIACPACRATVSQDAYCCPQCGKPLRTRPSDIMAILYLGSTAAAAFLLALLVVFYSTMQAPIAIGVILMVAMTIGAWLVFRNRGRR